MTVKRSAIGQRGKMIRPAKPRRDFPLYCHSNGQWAKRVRGKVLCFGPWDDPLAAEHNWDNQKDDLLAGRQPRKVRDDGGNPDLTVEYLCNHFLNQKKSLIPSGEIGQATYRHYKRICECILERLGRRTLVDDLTPDDFARFRKYMADRWGPTHLATAVTRVRMVFKLANADNLTRKVVCFGTTFIKPKKKAMRKARNHRVEGSDNGLGIFKPSEIRAMLEAADPRGKAMILLGLNCGFGNSDVACLPIRALDLKKGWVHFPRVKTEIARDCPLWPETIAALRDALAQRPEPKHPDLVVDRQNGRKVQDLLFISKGRKGYCEGSESHWLVTQDFRAILAAANAKRQKENQEKPKDERLPPIGRPGLGFYALRHNFATWGMDSRDKQAVEWLMGYAPASNNMLDEHYCKEVNDQRKRAVVECVRKRLYGADQE